ncbi:ABC transporter substrate-binding protein [Phormidesmis sp. 146-35]
MPLERGNVSTQPVNIGLHYNPSLEVLLKSKPDLILGMKDVSKQYSTLAKIAPALVLDWSNMETNLNTIAAAVRKLEQARRIIAEMKQSILDARQLFAPFIATHPKALILSTSNMREINLFDQESNHCSSPLLFSSCKLRI